MSVAAIPEGLPAVLTITLAVGVQAMARRNAIVRRLPAIETLGSVSVICTDKTGTLTRNEMMVASVAARRTPVFAGGHRLRTRRRRHARTTAASTVSSTCTLAELARAAAFCNERRCTDREGVWAVEGDPMEGALLALAGKVGLSMSRKELSAWTPNRRDPFDARHRFMATLHHDHGPPRRHLRQGRAGAGSRDVRGAAHVRRESGEPLDEAYWHRAAPRTWPRTASACWRSPPDRCGRSQTALDFTDVEGGLVLIGLVGLIDPPRAEAIEAVAECHGAGIRVKMITGDHAGTAAAIGRQIGLENPGQGADRQPNWTAWTMPNWPPRSVETDIFARTSPEHKLRLVMALQSQGLTVAMTGDGVNDAPALKRADAGIAMGRKGSEAAKEAAELVLADDNFASIVAAVREGRTVYDNIKKVISWTLPTNAGEAMTIIVALLFGMTLPITPVQILWVNLITAVTLGIALAFEPTEDEHHAPAAAPARRAAADWRAGLAHRAGLGLFLGGVFGIYAYAIDRGYSSNWPAPWR